MSDDALRRLARALEARGMAEPARLLAEAHRPMAPLLSDLGAALGPLLRAIGGPRAGGLAGFVADEAALVRLTDELDELERSRAEPR